MKANGYQDILNQFKTISSEEWKQKIIKDLKGEPFEKLIHKNEEEIEILPFYTEETLQKYQLNIPEKQQEAWNILERIIVTDVEDANRNALNALLCGADSILFDLQNNEITAADVSKIIDSILTDIAPVYFENYSTQNKIILESVLKNSCPATLKIPFHKNTVDALVFAIKKGIEKQENNPSQKIIFHFLIGQNYFIEIAKIRAFRWLWKQVCDIKKQPYLIEITSETSTIKRDEPDEYTNILRNTTEAMSAILGGSDTLIINSHDYTNKNSAFGQRIARNIHHILQNESYFSELKDMAKGAYYLEYLTYQLAHKTWNKISTQE